MGKILTAIVIIILVFVAVQSYYYGKYQGLYCSVAEIEPKKLEYLKRKMNSKDPYTVVHIDENLLNYALEKAQEDETIDYQVCAKIDDLRGRINLFIAKSPLWWFTVTLKTTENEPYIKLTKINYGVLPLPDFVRKTIQSEIVNNYRTYFEKRIPVRKVDKIEIDNGEILIYSKYY